MLNFCSNVSAHNETFHQFWYDWHTNLFSFFFFFTWFRYWTWSHQNCSKHGFFFIIISCTGFPHALIHLAYFSFGNPQALVVVFVLIACWSCICCTILQYFMLLDILYTPYISRGFYFREFRKLGAIRKFNNTQKYLPPIPTHECDLCTQY